MGVLEGTDKSSSVGPAWDYLRHYQELFSPWRNEPINVIEIGVKGGASLNVWLRYFSRATIIGIDINPQCARLAGDRVVIEIGSQENPEFLHAVCAKHPPSIIIDDGSHLAHHVLYSFQRMFPALLPGGLYVIEDLAFHFGASGDNWKGKGTVSPPEYFLDLARGRLSTKPNNAAWGDERYIFDHVDSVTFVGSAVAIRKRTPRNTSAALAFAERQLQRSKAPADYHVRIAEYILRHSGPVERAERAVQEAIRISGRDANVLSRLVDVLDRQGRFEEAADVAREVLGLRPNDASAWQQIARIERRRGHVDDELAALEKSVVLEPKAANIHERISHIYQQKNDLARAAAAAQRAADLNPEREDLRVRANGLAQSLRG